MILLPMKKAASCSLSPNVHSMKHVGPRNLLALVEGLEL